MKLPSVRLIYPLLVAALIGVLGLLIYKTRAIDLDGYNEIVGTLRRLKQADAEWNVEVLHARTGLASNYDSVARQLPLIASLEEALRGKTRTFWSDREDSQETMIRLLDVYKTAMDQKIAAIERFKSENAIQRNSARFLPLAANDLIEASAASEMNTASRLQLEQELNRLLVDTMSHSITPEQPLRERINRATRAISQVTLDAPPIVRERAATLFAHVTTLLREQEKLSSLLAELAAIPTAKNTDELADANAAEHDRLLVQQQTWREILLVYAGFLLLFLAFAAWRLLTSWQLLRRTNAALKRANKDLKESQLHLVQAEKMSALGQMVAGIAHEINTPLAYVKGTFSVLAEQLPPMQRLASLSYQFTRQMREPQRDHAALNSQLRDVENNARELVENNVLDEMAALVEDGIHGIEQISEIVQNLKNFSRLDRAKVDEFSVEAGLDSTLLLARHMLKGKVEVRKEYGKVVHITGSPSQINQVFLNIISNAIQAMPQRAEPNIITLRTTMQDDRTVRVEIQDNGSGIPKDVVSKIFDPFFTTKPVGQGTGMGLSISYKIIKEHGGRILVDTEVGAGTVFSILLPIGATPPSQASEESGSQEELLEAA
ncbi:MAG TPA: DAHL domain-containing protein [Burkholderiaceae bacterium]|nr:DAHL domain-containing protein [Burkholderiaceae bacterium]